MSSVISRASNIAILHWYPVSLHKAHQFDSTIVPSKAGIFNIPASFSFFIACSISVCSAWFAGLLLLQFGQILRTKRWLRTNWIAGANKYGYTHIESKRGTDAIAELVCNVVKTRCPVNAAFTAISAVSFDLVSHTKIISGSWRKIAFNPVS